MSSGDKDLMLGVPLDESLETICCLGGLQTLVKETRLKLYAPFRTEGSKTIPYPAACPCIAHIGEYPTPPFRDV